MHRIDVADAPRNGVRRRDNRSPVSPDLPVGTGHERETLLHLDASARGRLTLASTVCAAYRRLKNFPRCALDHSAASFAPSFWLRGEGHARLSNRCWNGTWSGCPVGRPGAAASLSGTSGSPSDVLVPRVVPTGSVVVTRRSSRTTQPVLLRSIRSHGRNGRCPPWPHPVPLPRKMPGPIPHPSRFQLPLVSWRDLGCGGHYG
jgi:hypothetical protein